MSLINEALKRTRDAAFKSGANHSSAATGYRVGSGSPGSTVGPRTTSWTTLIVAAIVLVAGIVVATRFVKNARSLNDGLTDTISRDTTASVPATPPEPATVQPPAREPDSKPADDKLVAEVVEKIKAAQASAASRPEPPKLSLQGITSDGATREAMINGVNVREGDDIEGARVVAIEPHIVRLQFDQRMLVLRMP